jgi:uncharacterized repeat protein (TIGR01451 family)
VTCLACLTLAAPLLAAGPIRDGDDDTAPPEIVNVATCEALLLPASHAVRVLVHSNPARTPVLGGACAGELLLTLDPAGPAHPGDTLVLTLRAVATGPLPTLAPRLTLTVSPGFVLPADTSGAVVTTLTGVPLLVPATLDVAGRRVVFDLPDLLPGTGVLVRIPLTLSAAASGDVSSTAELQAAGCAATAAAGVTAEVVPFGLTLHKRADRDTAWPGDVVGYTLEASGDPGTPAMTAITVVDTLPEGFRYAAGSARLDGAIVPDPAIAADGRTLRFALGPLPPATVRRLTYAAVLGADVREGDAVNRAHAEGRVTGDPASPPSALSPEASASVRVRPGPFRREATLVGQVFVDDDADGLPDEGEPGVPGVLVLLEDGRGAVTDPTGRWHLEGVSPGLHAARADLATVPPGLTPESAGPTWAGGTRSRFVEVRASALEIVDLPFGPRGIARCTVGGGTGRIHVPAASLLAADGTALPEAAARIEAAAEQLADQSAAPEAALACTGTAARAPGIDALRALLAARLATRLTVPPPAATPAAAEPLAEAVRTRPVRADILSPATGTRLATGRTSVEVLYPTGTVPELRVDGQTVPASRIGTHTVLPSRGLQAARYVGVELSPGRNRVEFRATALGGHPSEVPAAQVELIVPADAVELRLSLPEGRLIAGGGHSGVLHLETLDAFGVRAAWGGTVTLRTEGAAPLTQDLDPAEDGLQVRLRDGLAEVRMDSPALPGQLHAWARSDRLEAELVAPIVPAGGAWQVVGVAEGNLAGDAGAEGHGGEPPGIDRGISDGGGRVAFFGRGAVGPRTQLTVSVDTARQRDPDRLFDGREDEATFPVHGDTSVATEDTAHQGPVFLRLDAPSGFAQWGDAATGLDRAELARYDRRLSGLTGEVRRGAWGARAFAAPTDARVVRDVFEPDGTSGPYLLSRAPVVLRSERIVLETRDRFRTDEVLARRTLVPTLDYDLEAESGALLLRRALPPFDADLNPQRLVILYEARTGGTNPVAAGLRVDVEPLPGLTVGGSAVREGRDGEDLSLLGLDLRYRPRPGILFRAEATQSDDGDDSAHALAAALSSRGPKLDWELSYRDLPASFANPTYLGSPELGSRRTAARASWQPGEGWRLRGEAYAQDTEVGLTRSAVKVDAERDLGQVTALAGIAAVASEGAGLEHASATMATAGIRAKPLPRWTVELLRQQALGEPDVPGYPDRTALGVGFDLDDRNRITLRQEWESGGPFPTRDRTVLGLDSRVSERTRALARYTLEEGETGMSLRSSAGIETVWPLSPANSVTGSVSRVSTERGDATADYTALGAGWERRLGRSLASARYELRLGEVERRHLATLAAGWRLSDPWTLFASERLFATDAQDAASSHRVEGRLGAAWRPAAGAWQLLARLDHALGSGIPTSPGGALPGAVPSEPLSSAGMGPAPPTGAPGLGTVPPRYLPAVQRDAAAVSLAAGFRPRAGHRLAGTLVFRHVDADPFSGVPGTATTLLSLHYTADLGARWTLGGSVRRFDQDVARTTVHGAGVEVGWMALRDVWLVSGYNVAGFSDGGFADAGRTDRGFFGALRVKFDETTLPAWRDLRLDQP